MRTEKQTPEQRSAVGRLIRFCLENRLIVALFTMALIFAGLLVAPFDWKIGELQRYPISVDAIPDIGENQQIVFTEWMGRSPQDIEDQIGYPLTVQLLGIPGVKTVRSYSMFGFSSIYIIFKENVEFYWSRTRVLEKLNSLPAGTLPNGVKPALGPDATALGQVYWYTLEGLDPEGNRRAAGTRKSYARFKTGMPATGCWRPKASPKSPPWADTSGNIRSMSIPMPCARSA